MWYNLKSIKENLIEFTFYEKLNIWLEEVIMEIKKCSNCGSFITSESTLCSSCANKANYDMTLLKNYFDNGCICRYKSANNT